MYDYFCREEVEKVLGFYDFLKVKYDYEGINIPKRESEYHYYIRLQQVLYIMMILQESKLRNEKNLKTEDLGYILNHFKDF